MILLNFSHPISGEQLTQVRRAVDADVSGERTTVHIVKCQTDIEAPLAEQVGAMMDGISLTPAEWQTLKLLVNPPALSSAAVLVLAELHGRCGYYPPHIRLKKATDSMPPHYVLAEIMDVTKQREMARQKR